MPAIISTLMLWSVLVPTKMWYAPNQPITLDIKPQGEVTLMLTDFSGKVIPTKDSGDFKEAKTIDLKAFFPGVIEPGTYVLWAVPQGKNSIADFVGTPVVIEARQDKREGARPGANVIRVEPLCCAVMSTEQGDMTLAFYYDSAPNTVDNFLRLSKEGFYDGLTFHRIVPGFVIQGGDPRGDGSGGPGYQIPAEFNDHKHLPGVLSMARTSDPDSASSQFFVCLDYAKTQQLDGKYTAFGIVVDGMDAVKKIAATPLSDASQGTPAKAQVIKKVEVKPVVPGHNPYAEMMGAGSPKLGG